MSSRWMSQIETYKMFSHSADGFATFFARKIDDIRVPLQPALRQRPSLIKRRRLSVHALWTAEVRRIIMS